MSVADVEVVDDQEVARARLRIRTLPRARPEGAAPLLDLRADGPGEAGVEPVQLLEGQEYAYEVVSPGPGGASVVTDKPEMFVPDPDLGHRGRLRTGLYTGTLRVRFTRGGEDLGSAYFEVRSTKLDYRRSYRWMLRDIADVAAEWIMARFAPTEHAFMLDGTRDAPTLYQRFAFLRSQIESDDFEAAMHRITSSPHVVWEEIEQAGPPSCGARASSRLARSIAAVGPRVPWPAATPDSAVRTLPRSLRASRTEITFDNPPNRFVKFTLERWRSVVADIGDALRAEQAKRASVPVARGLQEVAAVLARLDALLAEELFREVGAMGHLPAMSQVLQKREGYRDILALAARFELAATLAWSELADTYSAGQRDVARLYESWVYLQIGKAVASVCSGTSFDAGELLERRDDGLALRLRTGERLVMSGSVERLGRTLRLELWFNRTFGSEGGSWTRGLRPDCSLLVSSNDGTTSIDPVWIHFDAKYRVDDVRRLFGAEQDDESRADDLLKMHAYKDAIRRTVGAYVIYPGSGASAAFREYHEILPGLGAFALRPVETSGEAEGLDGIVHFIKDVVDHLALQLTQHERARYWHDRIYASSEPVRPPSVPAARFLDRPPADMPVLLAHAKSTAHRAWIAEKGLYNLRADPERGGAVGAEGRELTARLVVVLGGEPWPGDAVDLYRVVGVPCVLTGEQLLTLGYPDPRGVHYLCLTLDAVKAGDRPGWLLGDLVRRIRATIAPAAPAGAPVVTSWLTLCLGLGPGGPHL